MYCPNCGAQNKKKQNFCRYCGLQLGDIEKTFDSQMVFGDDTKRLKQLGSIRKTTDFAQYFSVVLLLIGVISMIFFDARFGKVIVTASLLSFFVAQAVRTANGYFQRNSPRRRVANSGHVDELSRGVDTNKLIENRGFTPATVTEHTTARLDVKSQKTK